MDPEELKDDSLDKKEDTVTLEMEEASHTPHGAKGVAGLAPGASMPPPPGPPLVGPGKIGEDNNFDVDEGDEI